MAFQNHRNLFLILLLAVITLFGYNWLIRQEIFQEVISWARQNFALYFTLLVLVKMLGIIWPPLPGGLFTMGSIPVIGWFPAFLAEALGGGIGASTAYVLGKKYGYSFLAKILDENMLTKIRRLKINKKRELEAMFFVRLFTGGISEVISYGAGIIGVRFRNFFLATLLAIMTSLPIFYFLNKIFLGKHVFIYAPVWLLLAAFFWKMRGRYFE